jgi:hypothetical protein
VSRGQPLQGEAARLNLSGLLETVPQHRKQLLRGRHSRKPGSKSGNCAQAFHYYEQNPGGPARTEKEWIRFCTRIEIGGTVLIGNSRKVSLILFATPATAQCARLVAPERTQQPTRQRRGANLRPRGPLGSWALC